MSMTILEKSEAYDRLMAVILDVHSQHADDNCWLDIDRVFKEALKEALKS